jgi:hypothetical protein
VVRRRTGDWVGSARAVEYSISLSMLRKAYAAWENEEGENIEVLEAVGRFLKADAKIHGASQ